MGADFGAGKAARVVHEEHVPLPSGQGAQRSPDLYSVSSEQIQGIGRDADYIAKKIAAGRKVRRAGRSVGDPSEGRDAMASSAGA